MPKNKPQSTAFYRDKQAYCYNFEAEGVTSDGAILLSEKIEKETGIIASFARLIPDYRNPFYIQYSYEHMLKQRVFLMMQGYEDCNDEEKLRDDPVITSVLGNELCSQPTLSRFENKSGKYLIYALCHWFVDRYVSSLPAGTTQVIIDVDSTDDPTHGSQQLSMFHGYYRQHMYHELLFKDGRTGQVILPALRRATVIAIDGLLGY